MSRRDERARRAHERALADVNGDRPEHPVRDLIAMTLFVMATIVFVAWASGYLSVSVHVR